MAIVVTGLLVIVLDSLFLRLMWKPTMSIWYGLDAWAWRFRMRQWKRKGGKDLPLRWLGLLTQMIIQLFPLVLIGVGGWIAWEVLWVFGVVFSSFVGW